MHWMFMSCPPGLLSLWIWDWQVVSKRQQTDYQSMLSNIPEQRRSLIKLHSKCYIKYSLYSWTAVPLNIGLTGCPETSATDYQSMLSNIPEQRRSLIKFHSKCYIKYSFYFFNSVSIPVSYYVCCLQFCSNSLLYHSLSSFHIRYF